MKNKELFQIQRAWSVATLKVKRMSNKYDSSSHIKQALILDLTTKNKKKNQQKGSVRNVIWGEITNTKGKSPIIISPFPSYDHTSNKLAKPSLQTDSSFRLAIKLT